MTSTSGLGLVLLAVSACGGAMSQADVEQLRRGADARNATAFQHSRDAYVAAHGLRVLDEQPAAVDANAKRVPSNDHLVVVDATATEPAHLAFTYPSPCGCGGCDTSVQYAVTTAQDGSVVVLRLVANDHVRKVRQAGQCTYGCGVPTPPNPPMSLALPTGDPSRVSLAEVHYDREIIDAACERNVAAP